MKKIKISWKNIILKVTIAMKRIVLFKIIIIIIIIIKL